MQAELFFNQCNDIIKKNLLSPMRVFEEQKSSEDTAFVDDFADEFSDDDFVFEDSVVSDTEVPVETETNYFKSVSIQLGQAESIPEVLKEYFYYFLNKDLHFCDDSVSIAQTWNLLFQSKVENEEEALQQFLSMIFQLSVSLDAIQFLNDNFKVSEILGLQECVRTLHKRDLEKLLVFKEKPWFSMTEYARATFTATCDDKLFSLMQSGAFVLSEFQEYCNSPITAQAYFELKAAGRFDPEEFASFTSEDVVLQDYVYRKLSDSGDILADVLHRSDYDSISTIIKRLLENVRVQDDLRLLAESVKRCKNYCGLQYILLAIERGVPLCVKFEEECLAENSKFLKSAGEAYIAGVDVNLFDAVKADYYLYTFNSLAMLAGLLEIFVDWDKIGLPESCIHILLEKYWDDLLSHGDILKFIAMTLHGDLKQEYFQAAGDFTSFNQFCYRALFSTLKEGSLPFSLQEISPYVGASVTIVNINGVRKVFSVSDCLRFNLLPPNIGCITRRDDLLGFVISPTKVTKADLEHDLGIPGSLDVWINYFLPLPEDVNCIEKKELPFRSNLLLLFQYCTEHQIKYQNCHFLLSLGSCKDSTYVYADRMLYSLATKYQNFIYLLLNAPSVIVTFKELLAIREVETESRFLYRFLFNYLKKQYKEKFVCDMKGYGLLTEGFDLTLCLFDKKLSLDYAAFLSGFFGFVKEFQKASKIKLGVNDSKIILFLLK